MIDLFVYNLILSLNSKDCTGVIVYLCKFVSQLTKRFEECFFSRANVSDAFDHQGVQCFPNEGLTEDTEGASEEERKGNLHHQSHH